jgi:hypothetical protein
MITQIQIRNQASHAAAATHRSDELAVGSVTAYTDKVPQMLVGPQADQSFFIEVVCAGVRTTFPPMSSIIACIALPIWTIMSFVEAYALPQLREGRFPPVLSN